MIDWMLSRPSILPALDPDFKPPVLAHRTYLQAVKDAGGGVPLVLSLERGDGSISRYETRVFEGSDPRMDASKFYVERLVKFLLWQRGGWRIHVGGPQAIGDHIESCYSADGNRAFDYEFMGESVYDKPFTVVVCTPEDVPAENEDTSALGRHLEGYRIGFDLGGSDRKVSAVVNGEAIYSEEVMWNPIQTADPTYHYNEVMTAIKTAASKMPRLDAIGGSAAGVYVNNRARIASLFRAVPKDRYHEVHELFPRISREMGVPLVMVNDGEVTALAGSMSLEDNGVLGIAMGTSEAGGYVNLEGNITGWLNELAFCPVDYNPAAAVDEWSKDCGVGALYFSQQCAFRLAPKVGITLPEDILNAEKLKIIQDKMEAGDEGAVNIWKSMGVYLGYTLAHYADFYDIKHALILGRVTSGKGGDLLLTGAGNVLKQEFPELAEKMCVQLPDEKSRRVGQSIAAASLPDISK
jgi:predicted NBD/HSP70 family sugar kinase